MKLKKLLLLLLTMIMLVSLVACGNKEESNKGDNTSTDGATVDGNDSEAGGKEVAFPLSEKKEFKVFSILNGEHDLKDNITMQTLLEEANMDFQYDSVMGSDLLEKRNLILGSGEYPDVFLKSSFSISDLDRYGSQGIFIPLEDLIREYAPNLTAKLDEMNGWDYLTSGDGHIYSLPEIGRQQGALTTYWINKKWMDNLGLNEPTSIDDLYHVLKEFKEKDANGNGDPNDEIPLTATDVVKPDLLLPYFGIGYDYGTKTAVIDGELTYIPTSDVFKEYVAFITKLYQEEILDKNAFTQKHEQQAAIGQSADVLGSFFDAGAFLTVGRDNDDDYMALTPFEDGLYPLNTGITPGALTITDACENPEVIIAWFDQFYTEEGGIYALLGIEDKTWKMNADGTWEWIIGEGYGDDIATVRASSTIQGAANHPSVWPDFWFENMSAEVDPNEVYLNAERDRVAAKGAVPLPNMRYSDEDALTIATLKTDMDAYIDQYVAQVATGALELEGSWDDYISTLNNMGAGQLVEIYKNAYNEAISR